MADATNGSGLLTVLQQVLQHSRLLDEQRTVCALLCTSQAIRSVVRQSCAGQLVAAFSFHSLQQARQFAKWLKAHAKLLRSITIQLTGTAVFAGPKTILATDLIAEALQHAADAHPAGLLLQDVKLQKLHCTSKLLHQLQRSTQLTRLELQLCQRPQVVRGVVSNLPEHHYWYHQPELYKPLMAALAGLTSLQWLHLRANMPPWYSGHMEVLAPTLQGLIELTALEIDVMPFPALQYFVPKQLQQLHLLYDGPPPDNPAWGIDNHPLYLDHLTALTLLVNGASIPGKIGSRSGYQVVVKEGDKLPVNLQALVVPDVCSALPFQQLKQLTRLVLSNCTTSSADISMIASCCTQLQDVQLWDWLDPFEPMCITDLESYAPVWNQVPLTGLRMSCGSITAGVLQHIAGCRGTLQHLIAIGCNITATTQQIAAALAQLTRLHTLELRLDQEVACQVFQPAHGVNLAGQHHQQQTEDVTAADMELAVSRAIASMPKLTNLVVECFGPASGVVGHVALGLHSALLPLGTATQLTKLKLVKCGVTDPILKSVVPLLTNLRSLSVVFDDSVTCECLSCMADGLSNLELLDLRATDITIENLNHLQSLGKLPGVQVVASTADLAHKPLGSAGESDIEDLCSAGESDIED